MTSGIVGSHMTLRHGWQNVRVLYVTCKKIDHTHAFDKTAAICVKVINQITPLGRITE